MDLQGRAVQLLRETESSLRDLLEDALRAGDYQSLAAIARWADQVRELTGSARSVNTHIARDSEAKRARAAARTARPYPIFERAGNQLVKIAWSKTNRTEYEQRADRSVLDVLLNALKALSATKPQFAMDEVLPLSDPEHDTDIPDYQAYLALRWLRAIGVVKKLGRNTYSLSSDVDPEKETQTHWERLPLRS